MTHYQLPFPAWTAGVDDALPHPVVRPHQTHGAEVRIVTDENEGYDPEKHDETHPLWGVDAVITATPGLFIAVRTADCVPVLLCDPVKNVVAAVHAGWRGTVKRIVTKTIEVMQNEFQCQPQDLHAAIGPSISQDSFQVGQEVVEEFSQAHFPMDKICRVYGSHGPHIDLWAANAWLLEEAGMELQNIQIAGIDTYVDTGYYSARRDGFKCGRNTNAIGIK